VIATWVFLGPYALTLIIRREVVCMLCGPLFLLMTPVMFLFLKFYALANFGGMYFECYFFKKFILFYFILFYFILFYFILFYFILFYFILFYFGTKSLFREKLGY